MSGYRRCVSVGVPLQALRHAISHDTILTCAELEGEIMGTMSRKFGSSMFSLRQRLDNMLLNATEVEILGRIRGICRDPKDDYLLECAVWGHADALVTGDKDLPSLREYEGVRILTPRQYLDEARHGNSLSEV